MANKALSAAAALLTFSVVSNTASAEGIPQSGLWGARLRCSFPQGVELPCLVEIPVHAGVSTEEHGGTLNFQRPDGGLSFANVRVVRTGLALHIESSHFFPAEGNAYQTFFHGEFLTGPSPAIADGAGETFALVPFSPFNEDAASEGLDCLLLQTPQGHKVARVVNASQCQAAQWAVRSLLSDLDLRPQYLELKGFSPKGSAPEFDVYVSYNTPLVNSRLFAVKVEQETFPSGRSFTRVVSSKRLF